MDIFVVPSRCLLSKMLIKDQLVLYKDMQGIISFIGNNYVVIETNLVFDRKPARLVVYSSDYEKITPLL